MPFLFNDPNYKDLRRKLRRDATDAEYKLWYYLCPYRRRGLTFQRQYGVGRYILDFYCARRRLAIEVDGSQHYTPEGKEYDDERTAFLAELNIQVIRFTNNDVLENIEGVIKIIESLVSPR